MFSYPGIGSALLLAVENNDYALMQGIFLVITLAVLGANLSSTCCTASSTRASARAVLR